MELDGTQYRLIVESSPNMIWRAGTDALCHYFNATWLHFTGRTLEQEMGNGWAEGVHPDDLERCMKVYSQAFEARQPFEMDYRLLRYDQVYRWINDRGVPYHDDSGTFSGYIGSCMDVTDRVEGSRLREMARTDGLTRLFNRQYFEELARVEVQKSLRYGTNLCLTMMDVDRFKDINDSFGHQTGDEVLRSVAAIMKAETREFDLLGRYGGDEFILLLPETTLEEATSTLARLQLAISQKLFSFRDVEFHVSISQGTAQSKAPSTFEDLVAEADRHLYLAKQAPPTLDLT